MLEQHEDQAHSVKSSPSAELRAEKKSRVKAQNAQVHNSSSADQVQCTRAVIECEDRYKRSDECISDHQRCTIYLAERPAEGPAGKSARAEELLQREERLALGAHLGRGRICMLEQTKNQLVKDKPAGQYLQGQIVKEDLSSEDDEGQLERRSADKSN
ncbi:hypothetical protein F511_24761 [Dorcoceras hygrometricum]|uniref:Uncharacterized protein n=1 Tax=Dorcoceras hygrometricum TaxID=472368 RepID=A0A2Z7AZK5_9LAMI|nr:hypothetical protein F511_24761 [Dorcoceras hygrometricum]